MSAAPAPFEIRGLRVAREGTEILHGIDLTLGAGELHAVMGPNGSGKSTLANALMGNPEYAVTAGSVLLNGRDVTGWTPDERGKAGVFLGFQYPESVPGVKVLSFLQTAMSRRKGVDLSLLEVRLAMMDQMAALQMDPAFMDRHLNEGFSGGEKKRNEILQMALLEPDVAILDETDSGLDIDALRIVSTGITAVREQRPHLAALVITHYQRILDYLVPDHVHVLVDGHVVDSGGPEVAARLETEGYAAYQQEAPAGATV